MPVELDPESPLATYDYNKTLSITYFVNDTETGEPVDPTTVAFIYLPGSDSMVPVTLTRGIDDSLVRVSVGVYRVTIILNAAGFWIYRWFSEDPNDGEDGMLFVEPPRP